MYFDFYVTNACKRNKNDSLAFNTKHAPKSLFLRKI